MKYIPQYVIYNLLAHFLFLTSSYVLVSVLLHFPIYAGQITVWQLATLSF